MTSVNLTADYGQYGKEIADDLWEGKRTLILIDALIAARAKELACGISWPRPAEPPPPMLIWVYDLFLR